MIGFNPRHVRLYVDIAMLAEDVINKTKDYSKIASAALITSASLWITMGAGNSEDESLRIVAGATAAIGGSIAAVITAANIAEERALAARTAEPNETATNRADLVRTARAAARALSSSRNEYYALARPPSGWPNCLKCVDELDLKGLIFDIRADMIVQRR